ncbi:MAG: rhodanese-like domain-containing protein [Deltaproteobacteria bacterium]|nr:rhodanese-like domain-containing protein [Deltaproteobacteria bacterium]
MKKLFVLSIALVFVLGSIGLALAGDNPLRAKEKQLHKSEFVGAIPADKIIGVEAFKKVYDEVMAGTRKAYLIDTRTHPEFYAFHIEGTDHVHSGHVYTIPKKIKDPNAEIYIWCRTSHRAKYVVGFLYKYGYKNVYLYGDGVVGWARAGHPFVNQFTGKFKIVEYRKSPSDAEKSFRIREFHPY